MRIAVVAPSNTLAPDVPAKVLALAAQRYGASAPFETIYKELGLTVDKLVETAKGLVKK